MSYGFSVRGATVALAAAAVASKFDEVVATQPVHAKDREGAIAAATTFAGLISEPGEGQEVMISVSGSVGWQVPVEAGEIPAELTTAGVSVSATIVAKTE